MNHPARRPFGLARLSREDVSQGAEPVEEKLRKRRQIIMGLAALHNVPLREEDIFSEVESVSLLDPKGVVVKVLRLAKNGEMDHLITPYCDRILRSNKRDEVMVEEAFQAGKVKVITSEGVYDFGDPDWDSGGAFAFEIQSAVARNEVRKMSKKLRESNKVRAREGQRSGGEAIYGYRWVRPVYEGSVLLCRGHYETVDDEYPYLKEAVDRLWKESAYSIAKDFNRRWREEGVPVPPGLKRKRKRKDGRPINEHGWNAAIFGRWVANPFIVGFPALRWQGSRVRRIPHELRPREDWIMPEAEQDYPHPLTLATQQELLGVMRDRANAGLAKTGSRNLLTGCIYCSEGQRMCGGCDTYLCHCEEFGKPHFGIAVKRYRLEAVAIDVLQQVLDALPIKFLHRTQAGERRAAETRERLAVPGLEEAMVELNLAQQALNALRNQAKAFVMTMGEQPYRDAVKRAEEVMAVLKSTVEALQPTSSAPKLEIVLPLLEELKTVGFEPFWCEASNDERRILLQSVIARIQIVPPPRRKGHVQFADFTLHPWAEAYCNIEQRQWLPSKGNSGRFGHRL